MLQKDTVSASTLALIKLLMKDGEIQDFYLAGGTALALQLGHRKSIDIDLFIGSGFSSNALCDHLEEEYKFEVTYLGKNTILGFIGDVKVDLIAHQYPMINKVGSLEGIRMASLKDIAAMKFNAIIQNGSRLKDYVDISCLLTLMPLQKLLMAYEQKYPDVSGAIAQKALVYFEDIDFSVPLEYMPKFNLKWREIKSQLEKAAQRPNNTIQINQKKTSKSKRRKL